MDRSDPNNDTAPDPTDVRVGRILNDLLDRQLRGKMIDENQLRSDHPEFADELREHLQLARDLEPMRESIARLIAQRLLTPTEDERYLATLGHYKITGLVGRGGMGIVLRAYEQKLDRTVALKILRPELTADATALSRFQREAKAAAALRHPNIVTVHAVGCEGNAHYIAMECVDGPSLADVIDEHGPLPAELIRPIFRQLLTGLAAAHDAGLIHRDIKPSNILLDGFRPASQFRTATVRERPGSATLPPIPNRDRPYPSGARQEAVHIPNRDRQEAPEQCDPPPIPNRDRPYPSRARQEAVHIPSRDRQEAAEQCDPPPIPNRDRPYPSRAHQEAVHIPNRDRQEAAGLGDSRAGAPFRTATAEGDRGGSPKAEVRSTEAVERPPFTVKIADFGLARMTSSQTRITLPDSMLGTPEYMSPEQARGDPDIDHRTDLYSAGVVLYEMLTGQPPFKAETPTAVVHQIIYDEPTDPRTVHGSADRELSLLALRLMARPPVARDGDDDSAQSAAVEPAVRRRAAKRLRILWYTGFILSLCLLVSVGALLVMRPWREPPIMHVRVRTRHTKPTATIEVKHKGDEAFQVFGSVPDAAGHASGAVPVDCDGDDFPDLVVAGLYEPIVVTDSAPVSLANLLAYDARTGEQVWTLYIYDHDGWRDCSRRRPWRCKHLNVVDVDADSGGEELVVSASDKDEYPTVISVLDVHTDGAVVRAQYRHFGQTGPIHVLPRFYSGKYPALAIAAQNNKLDGFNDPHADDPPPQSRHNWIDRDSTRFYALMVLDPRELAGEGPPRSDRLPVSGVYAYAFLDLPFGTWMEFDENGQRVSPTFAQTAQIRTDRISWEPSSLTKHDGPELRFDVLNGAGRSGVAQIARRASFFVNRHLDIIEVIPEDQEIELPGDASWRPHWRQVIRDGEYVPLEE